MKVSHISEDLNELLIVNEFYYFQLFFIFHPNWVEQINHKDEPGFITLKDISNEMVDNLQQQFVMLELLFLYNTIRNV